VWLPCSIRYKLGSSLSQSLQRSSWCRSPTCNSSKQAAARRALTDGQTDIRSVSKGRACCCVAWRLAGDKTETQRRRRRTTHAESQSASLLEITSTCNMLVADRHRNTASPRSDLCWRSTRIIATICHRLFAYPRACGAAGWFINVMCFTLLYVFHAPRAIKLNQLSWVEFVAMNKALE